MGGEADWKGVYTASTVLPPSTGQQDGPMGKRSSSQLLSLPSDDWFEEGEVSQVTSIVPASHFINGEVWDSSQFSQ